MTPARKEAFEKGRLSEEAPNAEEEDEDWR
jgi:hypothetical protein